MDMFCCMSLGQIGGGTGTADIMCGKNNLSFLVDDRSFWGTNQNATVRFCYARQKNKRGERLCRSVGKEEYGTDTDSILKILGEIRHKTQAADGGP